MSQLYGGNAYFRFKQKQKDKPVSIEDVKEFRHLSSPAFNCDVFKGQQKDDTIQYASENVNLREVTVKRRSNSAYKIQLGQLGQQYQQNLRQTMRNQTKMKFREKEREKKSQQYDNYPQSTLDLVREKRGISLSSALASKNAFETITLLQKAISKDREVWQQKNKVGELHVTKLPMLQLNKTPKKRKKRFQSNEQPIRQPLQEHRSRMVDLRRKNVVEKPEICGWDHQDIHDY